MPDNYQECLLNSYTPLPVNFEYGNGVWLFDKNNKRYLDLISGLGVTGLGHSNPKIITAISNQSAKLLHVSNLVQVPQQAILAKMLVTLAGLYSTTNNLSAKVFFSNSGTEAIEAAIKLTRLYGHSKNITNPKIIVMDNAYHGRTLAALSATGNLELRKGFEPLLDCFIRIPFNDITALTNISSSKDAKDIVAILLEPIQGEGGISIPNDDYLKNVRTICSNINWLMMLDEVQTGIGRTGQLFCYQHYNIIPDVITIAKGLANGIPIGACIIKQPFADLFTPKSHGSTFGGNPLACSVAIASLQEITEHKLWEKAATSGVYFLNKLKQALNNNSHVLEVRGKGLMIGVELDKPCRDIMLIALEHGLLCNVTKNTVIRLLPPLIIEKEHIDFAVEKITLIINQFYSK